MCGREGLPDEEASETRLKVALGYGASFLKEKETRNSGDLIWGSVLIASVTCVVGKF